MMTVNESTWNASVQRKDYPPLKRPIESDVLIIGGGITGITAAYLLAKSGKDVVLVESGKIGDGATGYTTAFLTYSIDTETEKLMEMFGEERARMVLDTHMQAIDRVDEIVQSEQIDCEFVRCSNYIYSTSEKEHEWLAQEQQALFHLGKRTELKRNSALRFPNEGYLDIRNQAKFHPLKYLNALAEAAVRHGAQIYEHTKVARLSNTSPVTALCIAGKDEEKIELKSDSAIVATYAPFNKKLFFKKAIYISYVMELSVPHGSFPEGIYEDQGDPYHYFRVDTGKGVPIQRVGLNDDELPYTERDRIIVGGEDHRSDVHVDPTKNYQALEEFVKEIFFDVDYEIVRYWRGPIAEPIDGLAYIGMAGDEHIYYATGFSGNGMTYSNIAAGALRDAIIGVYNPALQLYAANRLPTIGQLVKKGADYGREFFGGAVKNSLEYNDSDHYRGASA